jgi:hypothetical protein
VLVVDLDPLEGTDYRNLDLEVNGNRRISALWQACQSAGG